MADILLLYLEGPMQSWGLRARWDVRDTGDEPSKSGVVGLLGAALGYRRDDPQLQELDEGLRMGVRVESPGVKRVDFQTIQGVFPSAAGKARGREDDPYTVISPRTYLHDAAFLVALEGEGSLLEECAAALQDPKWPMFLGRKACVPSRPVFERLTKEYSTLDEALARYPLQRTFAEGEVPERFRCVIEEEEGIHVRNDRLRINPARMYSRRNVRVGWVPYPGQEDAAAEAGSEGAPPNR